MCDCFGVSLCWWCDDEGCVVFGVGDGVEQVCGIVYVVVDYVLVGCIFLVFVVGWVVGYVFV